MDEIREIGLPLQAKLLWVMQSREFRKVGGKDLIRVDVRPIAATHRDLAAMARAGTFREDLFYRLEVLAIRVPPLRERSEDIPLLVAHERFNRTNPKQVRGVHPRAMDALVCYPWPGNVREAAGHRDAGAVGSGGP